MFVSKKDWIQVDGELITVSIQSKGASVYVVGQFRWRHIIGKGRTVSEAKSSWIRFAEYEANS
jgi:hypothetical protein